MNSYIILPTEVVMVTGGKQYTVASTHPCYQRCMDAIKANEWDKIPALVDVKAHINSTGQGKITVANGEVMWGSTVMHNLLTERLLTMLAEGFDVDPMIALLQNLVANPSSTAIDEFYLFFQQNKMPITEDGCIIAYKLVGKHFYDLWSETVFNKPAALMSAKEIEQVYEGEYDTTQVEVLIENNLTTVAMDRALVNPDRTVTCSTGLHFCSLAYLESYQSMQSGNGVVLLLKINPKDIVSIPNDYNNTKGRCWRYQVLGCLDAAEDAPVPTQDVYDMPVLPQSADLIAHLAYDQGYVDGRNKRPLDGTEDGEWYFAGYKDGRGKKKRQLPKLKHESY